MIQRLINWWHARQRAIDLQILWPVCCEQAGDIGTAKLAFAMHALHDEAWLCLGKDEAMRRIDALERP